MSSWCKGALLIVCCFSTLQIIAADAITGKVHNQTTNTAAVAEDVILLRLGDGMQEQARTKTDSQGAFEFHAVPDAHYIVRAMHQGVNYDQAVIETPLQIMVYDAVAKIPGLSGRMGIAQVEADGGALKVTEMYAISNETSPPVTQSGPRNFQFSLPPNAGLDSFIVKKAGGIWVKVSPSPVAGRTGSYTLDFPLRPGETYFKFSYHLPYDGRATLHLKLAYPILNFAVVHPPSMSFKARSGAFSSPGQVQGMRLEQAVKKPVVNDVPVFEVSGMGTAAAAAAGGPLSTTPSVAPTPAAPAGSSGGAHTSAPTSPSTPASPAWVIIPGIGAFLAAVIFAVWKRKRNTVSREAAASSAVRGTHVEALKQELFRLETEKLRGSISSEEYDSTRQALNANIQRALAREKN